MITLTREEAQQVLDALDEYRDSTEDFRVANRCISLIETLRARLSAPEPKQVLLSEFLNAVQGKENLVGTPVMMSVWPTKESA